jgi:hypothetical protein
MVDRRENSRSIFPRAAASSARQRSTPTAPCAGAGSHHVGVGIATPIVADVPAARARRRRAGSHRPRHLRAWPAAYRHCRGTARSSGRAATRASARRGAASWCRPRARRERRAMPRRSAGRAHRRAAASRRSRSLGRIVSTSFIEWTAQSISPSSSARSSSLVHSALPPISASARSCTLSPVVRIGTISIAGPRACAARSASRTILAWVSASGEPGCRDGEDVGHGLC